MSIASVEQKRTPARVNMSWAWFVVIGALLLVGGVLASANLLGTTAVAIVYIGLMMLVVGVMQLSHIFAARAWKARAVYGLSSLLYLIAGLTFTAYPVQSALSVSLVLGISLVVSGALKLVSAFVNRDKSGANWLALTGLFSGLIGIFVLVTWPERSLLGAILSFELFLQGWGFIVLGLTLRSFAEIHPRSRNDINTQTPNR